MPNYQRDSVRAICKGVQLTRPVDLLDDGKFPALLNVRSYTPGTITARPGLARVAALGSTPLHSLGFFEDLVPAASRAWGWLLGCGADLFLGQSTFGAAIDTGYSGDPLAFAPIRPAQSPEPWVYLGDAARMRKVRVDGTVWQTGITPPLTAPSLVLGSLSYLVIDDFEATTGWAASGLASAPTTVSRVATTISQIVYDDGTTGWASIVPTVFSSAFLPGMRLYLGGSGPETEVVFDVKQALLPTTIDSIAYDTGTTGWCTLVPASGVYGDEPPRLNQVLVDALITLGGTETVRIQAVIRQPGQGSLAFRCVTSGTFAAGAMLVGVASLRVFTAATHAPGDALTDTAVTTTLTIPLGGTQAQGALTKTGTLNLAAISDRAIQPDDLIHLSFLISDPTLLVEARMWFDVDATVNDFAHNAYWYAFRANDLTAAIAGTSTLLAAGQTIQSRDTGGGPGGGGRGDREPAAGGRAGGGSPQGNQTFLEIGGTYFATGVGTGFGSPGGQAGDGGVDTSGQIGTGADQWLELVLRVSDLLRIGPDTTRTLADVAKIRLSFWISGAALQTCTIGLDSWWIGGTFGPDVGDTGAPYTYCYRARSTATGAKSNPSPPTRSTVIPHRQEVVVHLTVHPDPQVDLLDVFRLGGALTGWHWVGSAPNETADFSDVWMDDSISGNETLPLDDNQPWPTVGTPKTGVVTVVGSVVTWVSGDVFDTGWLRNTLIQIAGQTYSLYAPPSSTTRLEINESAGTLVAQPFAVQEPLFAGQPFSQLWGPWDTRTWACGDPLAAGTLYCSKADDPDTATFSDFLEITSPSEPLMNGGTYDGRNFVFSTQRLFAIYPNPAGSVAPYSFQETPIGQGLGAPWFFCVGAVIYFGNRRGIFATDLAQTLSLTDADLGPLFYREGAAPVETNGLVPPDFSLSERLRLSTADGWLWFDYRGTDGQDYTLACDLSTTSWFVDQTTPGTVIHAVDTHVVSHPVYLGGVNGDFSLVTGMADNTSLIPCRIHLPSRAQGDYRRAKRYQEYAVDLDQQDMAVLLQPRFNADEDLGDPDTLMGSSGRVITSRDLAGGDGVLATSMSVELQWASTTAQPVFYGWEVLYDLDALLRSAWSVAPTTHGFTGYQHLRDAWFTYNSTIALTFTVTIDNVQYPYTLPPTNGLDQEVYLVCRPVKGLLFGYTLSAVLPFRLFPEDCRVRLGPWGASEGYQILHPFSSTFGGRATP